MARDMKEAKWRVYASLSQADIDRINAGYDMHKVSMWSKFPDARSAGREAKDFMSEVHKLSARLRLRGSPRWPQSCSSITAAAYHPILGVQRATIETHPA